jgi:hypothetical protein
MQALPRTPADVFIKISSTPAVLGQLCQVDVLEELLNALGRTGLVVTVVHRNGRRYAMETDGIRCSVEPGDYWRDPAQPGLDIRIEAMPGVVGVLHGPVEVALRNLLDRLGLRARDLQSYRIAGCQPVNMDAMRVRYGDNPAAWPASAPPPPMWILRKRRVFVQIRVLEPQEVG